MREQREKSERALQRLRESVGKAGNLKLKGLKNIKTREITAGKQQRGDREVDGWVEEQSGGVEAVIFTSLIISPPLSSATSSSAALPASLEFPVYSSLNSDRVRRL